MSAFTLYGMIKSFRSKALHEVFTTATSAKVKPDLRERTRERLLVLHAAKSLNDLNVPGFACHPLTGTKPLRYALRVNGPWRITFEWDGQDALRVDLEQYH